MDIEITEKMITESSLSDSVLYRAYNSNSEMTSLIISTIQDSIVINESHIQEQLIQINRTRISPLADDVVKAFNSGQITLLFSKTKKKVPQALPFFATKQAGKIKVFIFVNNYGTLSKNDASGKQYLNVPMKDLYVLMEGAYVALQIANNPGKVVKSLGLMKICCSIYTDMVLRILNREYTVSMDLDLYNRLVFCFGKFFIQKVWMLNSEDLAFSYAKSNIRNSLNINDIMLTSASYDDAKINNLEDLINFVRTFSTRLSGLNFRYFIQCYINTYKPGAMFGIECLPYFLYSIQAAQLGSFLVNQPMITDITKTVKGMNNFYSELVKAVNI